MRVDISTGAHSLTELAAWVGGEVVLHGIRSVPSVSSVCTDSREATADCLFCAIKGERTDGHQYIGNILRTGGICILCEYIPTDLSDSDAEWAALVVPNTIAALSRMAAGYRTDYLPLLHTVGITGSVGKTSVKELCASVLSAGLPTFRREGNFNSVIGMPLSMLEIDPQYETAVLEMGMSGRGEISAMTNAARPDIAVITNIGSSHLEMLGTRENIARAKLEIVQGLKRGGYLLIPADEPLLNMLLSAEISDGDSRADIRVMRVSHTNPSADVYVNRIVSEEDGSHFDVTVSVPFGKTYSLTDLYVAAPGQHTVYNAALAVAVGVLFGLQADTVRVGLSTYRPTALRQTVIQMAGVTLTEDCYNAAPESMRAALDMIKFRKSHRCPAAQCVAVLGDMKELGTDTVAMHRDIGAYCVACGVDRLITVGELGVEIANGAIEAGMPSACVTVTSSDGQPYDSAAVGEAVCERLDDGDCVLFKASRSMKFETISAYVKEKLQERLK